jgi:hypothetical protein
VEEGLAGGAPGAPTAYVAMAHLSFESLDAFQSAFAPHAEAIMVTFRTTPSRHATGEGVDRKCVAGMAFRGSASGANDIAFKL